MRRYYLWLSLLIWTGVTLADDKAIKKQLVLIMPNVVIDSLQPLDDTGLYEVVINGGEIVYFSADGRYVFQGDVIALDQKINITENKRISLRKQILSDLNEDDLIIYGPNEVVHTVTVFTDIDCGYCRKLHRQMAAYNDLGIRIRYAAFPRAGIDSDSFDKAEDVWCANDRLQAMTAAKNGQAVDSVHCDTPVRMHYETGRKIGVTSTPTLFLQSGKALPGYVPPIRLKQLLDETG